MGDMTEVSPDELRKAVENMHGGRATLIQSVPVSETFIDQPVWEGTVHVFDLDGCPNATRAYAWAQDRPDGKVRYAAVLRLGGITGPVEAVRAAIVAEARAGK